MSLVPFFGLLPNTAVAVESLDVSLLEAIAIGPGAPLGGTRISIGRGTSEVTAPTPPWVETSSSGAAVSALLASTLPLGSVAFASFPTLANPNQQVGVEVHHVSCLEPIDAVSTRISIRRAGSDLITPPFVDVAMSPSDVAAAIFAATPPPPVVPVFGTGFQQAAGGSFSTTSAVYVPVPGTQLTIPAGGAGTFLILASGDMSADTPLNGVSATIFKNGAPLGATFFLVDVVNPANRLPFFSQLFDVVAPTDIYEIRILASPGGGVPTGQIDGAQISLWRVS